MGHIVVPVCHLDGGFGEKNPKIWHLCYHISGPGKGMVPEQKGSLDGKSMG